MGYVELEIENAKYRVELRGHNQKVVDIIPCDAIVIEHGNWAFGKIFMDWDSVPVDERPYNLPQKKSQIDFAKEKGIDVLLLDVRPKPLRFLTSMAKSLLKNGALCFTTSMILNRLVRKKLARRKFLKYAVPLVGGLASTQYVWGYSFDASGKIEKREPLRKALSELEAFFPDAIVEARNAIVAEKME